MERSVSFEYDQEEVDSIDQDLIEEIEVEELATSNKLIYNDIRGTVYEFIFEKSLEFLKNRKTFRYKYKSSHEKLLYHLICKMRYIDSNPQEVLYKVRLKAITKKRFSVGYQFPREFMDLVQLELGIDTILYDTFNEILKYSGLFTQYFSNPRGYCSCDIKQCRQFIFNFSLVCGDSRSNLIKYLKMISGEYRKASFSIINDLTMNADLEKSTGFQYFAYMETLDTLEKPTNSKDLLRINPISLPKKSLLKLVVPS